jgi:hypothetical protein
MYFTFLNTLLKHPLLSSVQYPISFQTQTHTTHRLSTFPFQNPFSSYCQSHIFSTLHFNFLTSFHLVYFNLHTTYHLHNFFFTSPPSYTPFFYPLKNPLLTLQPKSLIFPFILYLPINTTLLFFLQLNIKFHYPAIHLDPIISTNLPLILQFSLSTSCKLTHFSHDPSLSSSYITTPLPSQLLFFTITHLHTIALSHSTSPYYWLLLTYLFNLMSLLFYIYIYTTDTSSPTHHFISFSIHHFSIFST